MSEKTLDELLDEAKAWWSTDIIEIRPGAIGVRGYPIEELTGNVGFVEMVWLMVRGELPTAGQARLFDAALVASVDHGPQAPSIAIARMAMTCGSAINNAMASAINVLDDIHGGAGQQCMELYREIDAAMSGPDDLVRATEAALARSRESGIKYVPGFGHRFHPVDPRAPRLLALVEEARAAGDVDGRFADIARAVEDAISTGRPKRVPMNIDGASAVVYSELGLPPELGRGVFVLSRSVGILAHAWEQLQQGGRIKGPQPKSIPYTYTGLAPRPVPNRPTN